MTDELKPKFEVGDEVWALLPFRFFSSLRFVKCKIQEVFPLIIEKQIKEDVWKSVNTFEYLVREKGKETSHFFPVPQESIFSCLKRALDSIKTQKQELKKQKRELQTNMKDIKKIQKTIHQTIKRNKQKEKNLNGPYAST